MQFRSEQWDHVEDGVAYPTQTSFPITRGAGPGTDGYNALMARHAWTFQTVAVWLPAVLLIVWFRKNRKDELRAGIAFLMMFAVIAAFLASREIERAYNRKLEPLGVRSNFNLFVEVVEDPK